MKKYFNGRFRGSFADPRLRPGWANFGVSNDANLDLTAMQAWQDMGAYEVVKRPMGVLMPNGQYEPSHYEQLRRLPTPDDFVERDFGVVTKDYVNVSPNQIIEAWDQCVRFEDNPVKIATMGAFDRGEILFITTKLPSYDVAGDQVDSYLVLKAPFSPNQSIIVAVTDVRVSCYNTLVSAIGKAISRFDIVHKDDPLKTLKEWLGKVYKQAVETQEVIKEAYEVLAVSRLTNGDVRHVLNTVYPFPEYPDLDDKHPRYKGIYERYQQNLERVSIARQDIVTLYNGAGTAMNVSSVEGTGFGLLNAVSEFEEWRRTSDARSAAGDLLMGKRSAKIAKAFSAIFEVI